MVIADRRMSNDTVLGAECEVEAVEEAVVGGGFIEDGWDDRHVLVVKTSVIRQDLVPGCDAAGCFQNPVNLSSASPVEHFLARRAAP